MSLKGTIDLNYDNGTIKRNKSSDKFHIAPGTNKRLEALK